MEKSIILTKKDIGDLERLRRCLSSGMIPVAKLAAFLDLMHGRVNKTTLPAKAKTSKRDRQEKYRQKITRNG